MRSNWVLATIGGLLMSAAIPAAAQVSDVPLPTRIAVADLTVAIGTTAEGKKVLEGIQKKYEPRQQQLEADQKELQATQERYNRQGTTLSEAERLRMERELQEGQRKLRRNQEDLQADFQREQQDAGQRLSQKMQRIIREYAAQNGYVLIIDSRQIPIHYIHKSIEITEDLIRRYNAAYPVQGAAPAAAPAAAKPATPSPATPSP